MPFKNKEDLKRYRRAYNKRGYAKKRRAANNKARRMMAKKYGKARLKGKDIDHKRPQKNGGKTVMSNLRISSIKKNRARKPKRRY